jgi:hypothetical protein
MLNTCKILSETNERRKYIELANKQSTIKQKIITLHQN